MAHHADAHLDESCCRVPPLLKVLLPVLLLDLQSKTRTQDPLVDRRTGEPEVELRLSQVKSANVRETHSRQSEE